MYSSTIKQALRKFTIRGSEMTRIKSSVVSMAAYAAMLVFIFAGWAGASNCPPDEEVNLRWETTLPTFMYHDFFKTLYVQNDHTGGTYSWSSSNSALGQINPINPGVANFITQSNGVGQVMISCTYTFEETGQPCSYAISNSIYVVGAEMFVDSNHDGQANASDNATEETPGGIVGQGKNIYVDLVNIPTAAEGTCTLKLSPINGQVKVFNPQNVELIIPSEGISWPAGTAPDYIRVYGAQASQSPRDVYLSYTYTFPDYYVEPEVDVIALTVVGAVDLDVDSNYDGQINGTDESLETSAGGVVPLGKRVPIRITSQGNVGALMLYLDSGYGNNKIRVWSAEEGGTEIFHGQTVSVGTYYVQGVSTSSSARDIQLRLRNTYGSVNIDDTIKLTVVKVEFNKDPVKVGIGANRTSETPAYPATTPATYPHRLIATITPKDAAGSVTFDSSSVARATVSEVSRTDVGNSKQVILTVTGVAETPAGSPGGDADIRARVGVWVCKTTKAIVIKPKTRTHAIGAAVVNNTAVLLEGGAGTQLTTSIDQIVTITIKDQFGNVLHSVYNGQNVVEEKFENITNGGLTPSWIAIRIPDREFVNGIKLDECGAVQDTAISLNLTPAQIAYWGAGTLTINGKNNTFSIDAVTYTTEGDMKLKVDGHEVTPDVHRKIEIVPNNHPPAPVSTTDS